MYWIWLLSFVSVEIHFVAGLFTYRAKFLLTLLTSCWGFKWFSCYSIGDSEIDLFSPKCQQFSPWQQLCFLFLWWKFFQFRQSNLECENFCVPQVEHGLSHQPVGSFISKLMGIAIEWDDEWVKCLDANLPSCHSYRLRFVLAGW